FLSSARAARLTRLCSTTCQTTMITQTVARSPHTSLVCLFMTRIVGLFVLAGGRLGFHRELVQESVQFILMKCFGEIRIASILDRHSWQLRGMHHNVRREEDQQFGFYITALFVFKKDA